MRLLPFSPTTRGRHDSLSEQSWGKISRIQTLSVKRIGKKIAEASPFPGTWDEAQTVSILTRH